MSEHGVTSDHLARRRFFTIQAARLAGLVLLLTGILALNGGLAIPPAAGYAMAAIGLVLFAVVPIVLARRWRSPRG